MMHVKQIREVVEERRRDEAFDALDRLLELGPYNTEALKLKALLYAQKGQFQSENDMWRKVIEIDREDPDAINYFQRKHLEDNEYFYFSDELIGGGRRFLTYPRKLIRNAMLALAGCISFLLLSTLYTKYPLLQEPVIILPLFIFLVLIPWLFTVSTWFFSVRHISINKHGIVFKNYLGTRSIFWKDVHNLVITYNGQNQEDSLTLVIETNRKELPCIEVNLMPEKTIIRARHHFITAISSSFKEPSYSEREKLNTSDKIVLI